VTSLSPHNCHQPPFIALGFKYEHLTHQRQPQAKNKKPGKIDPRDKKANVSQSHPLFQFPFTSLLEMILQAPSRIIEAESQFP
jgi:hypothetical protein